MNGIDLWKRTFDDHTDLFTRSFGNLDSGALNWKPTESAWSIGQIIEHLIRINESYYPILDGLRQGNYSTPWTARLPFIPRFFGKFILDSVEPDRRKKVKTFPAWEPSSSAVDDGIVERFRRHHQALIEKLDANRDLFGKGNIVSSPANRLVVYTLDDAIEILVRHERRHYNQASEVLALQKGTQF